MKLKKFLNCYNKLIILGIGNELRGDDFLGSLIVRRLAELFNEKTDIMVFDGGTVPENYTGAIKKADPSHIILIDAADMGEVPGYVKIVSSDKIVNYHLSTHTMPLSSLVNYLKKFTKAEVILIGIQPKTLELSDNISSEIENSVEYIINTFLKILS